MTFTSQSTPKDEILAVFTGGTSGPLGNAWVITAKKTDFYINPVDFPDTYHLSAHGPNERDGSGHRFHFRVNETIRKKVPRDKAGFLPDGQFLANGIPRNGQPISGQPLAKDVWRVARIRWSWDVGRPRFRDASSRGAWPEVMNGQQGIAMRSPLPDNTALDVDICISYNKPYWPHERSSLRNGARLGPLKNLSDMWLTGTVYQRSQTTHPAPDGLLLGLPRASETAQRIMGGGIGEGYSEGLYWLVDSITSKEILDLNANSSDLTSGIISRKS